MSYRKLPPTLILAAVLAAGVGTVLAVHDLGLFELDGDALNSSAPGDDWDSLFPTDTSPNEKAKTFAADGADPPVDTTYFTGGGSKDIQDVSQWLHTTTDQAPDKDEITNAYAAAYTNTTDTAFNDPGDLIIYFGADRFAENGDAQIGFWFFQNTVGLNPDGTFNGVHAVGDVLVLSDFTQGGNVSTIKIFKWVGAGGSDGALDLVGTGVDCTMGLLDDPACATVNDADTAAPWAYTPKFGAAGTFPRGSFFEGGINVTRLLGTSPCFSSFLAETRSSQSVSAQLKDFALGAFELCAITVDKTGPERSKVGDEVTYTITITNTGAVTLHKDDITDTLLGPITVGGMDQGNVFVTSNTCGPSLAAGASCTITASREVMMSDPDPLENTVTVTYRGNADLTGEAISASDDHSVNLFQPGVVVTKVCDTLSKAGDDINCTITVTNTSSADSPPLVNGTIADSLLGNLLAANPNVQSNTCAATLMTAGSCTIITRRTTLASDPDPLVNTVTVHFNPQGFPNDITASASASVDLVHPGLMVGKECVPRTALPGDAITFTCTITNTGDVALDRVSIVDSLQGDLTNPANVSSSTCGGSLAAGESCSITYTRPAPSGTTTLTNTVTAIYQVSGLPNLLTASASCTVTIVIVSGGSANVTPAVFSTSAGSNTLSGTFQIINSSGGQSIAVIDIDLEVRKVAGGQVTVIPSTCTVTPSPSFVIPQDGTQVVGFTCTRTDGKTFASGDELKVFESVILNGAQNNPFTNQGEFRVP